MQERIKELEAQCWYQEPCDFDMREGGLSTMHTMFDRKKFAKLIVEECVKHITDQQYLVETNWQCKDGVHIVNNLKEHFRV